VMPLTAVEEGDDHSRIEQYGSHLPKPSRCFGFDPRSRTPEENFPRPAIRGRRRGGLDVANRRIPCRTISEGLQPRRLTSCSRFLLVSSSSLACTVVTRKLYYKRPGV
jgi:hypothetical protein